MEEERVAAEIRVDVIVIAQADRLGEPRKPQKAEDPEGHDSRGPHPCDPGADSGFLEAGRNDPGNRGLPCTVGPEDRIDLYRPRGIWRQVRRGRLDRWSDR